MALSLGVEGLGILVTGGAGGAGRVIAESFADAGAHVLACDIDDAAVKALQLARPDITAYTGDVGNQSTVDAMFAVAEARFGMVNVLVNNVGVAGPTAAVEDITLEDWAATLTTNLTSHFLCVRRAVRRMKAIGAGLIVNVSSVSAKVGLPLRLPYIVSKGALLSFTQNLARELGPSGIRVNAILPGPIRGARVQRVINVKAQALGIPPAEYERSQLRYISLRTMVDPDDIAAMILFLASAGGRRITGQLIGVDGNVEYEE
jgi:NAD(P)-dependent dehydrogenase (short-subunit alcohol dehydrogenase family)